MFTVFVFAAKQGLFESLRFQIEQFSLKNGLENLDYRLTLFIGVVVTFFIFFMGSNVLAEIMNKFKK